MTLAGFAREAGAETFLIVSAMGANPSSRMFYNRVKGTVERELRRIGLPRTYVFRPSLLLGRREEFRAGERVAVALAPLLSPLLTGPFAKYRPIAAADVATAMRLAARSQRQDEGDWTVFESDAIARLARSGG
ncbi:hypothetical protein ACFQWB_13710 [Paenibacillus thermoaerophilus]|uniref:Oxidoreductase n=1 Tax=Paenibacillus thermoaerophilus TaxID=1215385 RepID=A0ABW2V4D1_9BACL|nr:hypothetical protein [Paenibacillus thermoaerophilus]